MATTARLEMKFLNSSGEKIIQNLAYCDPDVNDVKVKALMQGIVANGEIFEKEPAGVSSAQIVVTERTAIDLN